MKPGMLVGVVLCVLAVAAVLTAVGWYRSAQVVGPPPLKFFPVEVGGTVLAGRLIHVQVYYPPPAVREATISLDEFIARAQRSSAPVLFDYSVKGSGRDRRLTIEYWMPVLGLPYGIERLVRAVHTVDRPANWPSQYTLSYAAAHHLGLITVVPVNLAAQTLSGLFFASVCGCVISAAIWFGMRERPVAIRP